jgi:predicted oxidoreductase
MSRIIAGVMKWGIWGSQLNTKDMSTLIEGCLSEGVDTFDHADIYGGHTTEMDFGRATQQMNLDRSSYRIISKCGIVMPSANRPDIKLKHYNTSAEYIVWSVNQSLANLQSDYLDLLLIHRPSPLMNPAEIAKAVDELLSSGKIKSFGVSNFTPSQVDLLRTMMPVSTNQIEISVLHSESMIDGSIDFCRKNNIAIQAWSPLGGGALFNADDLAVVSRLKRIAHKYEWSMDQLAYLFLLHHPAGIQPIVGSSRIERIRSAVACVDMVITDEQWFDIYAAVCGKEVP